MIHKEKAKSETTLPLMFQREWVKESLDTPVGVPMGWLRWGAKGATELHDVFGLFQALLEIPIVAFNAFLLHKPLPTSNN
jgi:hypothetical protein